MKHVIRILIGGALAGAFTSVLALSLGLNLSLSMVAGGGVMVGSMLLVSDGTENIKQIVYKHPWIASFVWGVVAFVVLYVRPLVPEERMSRVMGAFTLAVLNVVAVRGLLRYAKTSEHEPD